MRTFAASDQRVLTIRASKQRVADALSVPDQVKQYLADGLESSERIDDTTIRFIRKPVDEVGVRFRGDYIARYAYDGNGMVTWTTVSTGNMRTRGEARLTALDETSTRVEYKQTIECDMDVNRILAVVLRPIVERNIKAGIGDFLAKVKAGLER